MTVEGAKRHWDAQARPQLLKRAQFGRRKLGLEEEDWRDLLERVAGERSAKALTADQLGLVLGELERLGFVPESSPDFRPASKKAHVRKVYALWGELKRKRVWKSRHVASLDLFVKKIAKVDSTEWLTPVAANKVIEALKAMAAKAGVDVS